MEKVGGSTANAVGKPFFTHLLFIWRFPCAKAVVMYLSTLILAIFVDKRIVSLWLLDLTEDVGHERRCKSQPDGSNMLFFFPAKSRSGPTTASQYSYSLLIA